VTFATSPADAVLVDAHVHVFTRDMPLVPNPRHSPDYSFTVEQLLDTMDRHGVHYAVIAAASPWGDYNDYVLESLGKSARLRGTIIADPSVEKVSLDAMHAAGMRGVRLPFIGLPELPDLDSWNYRKFLRRLVDLDWHVHVHIEGPRLPAVLPLLEQSGVKIVIDPQGPHLGEDVGRLPAGSQCPRMRAGAVPRSGRGPADVGQRLPLRGRGIDHDLRGRHRVAGRDDPGRGRPAPHLRRQRAALLFLVTGRVRPVQRAESPQR